MKYLLKYLVYVLGLVVVVILVIVALPAFHKANAFSVTPSSGPEGTTVTFTYPKTSTPPPAGSSLKFYDAGEHGYYAVNNGAATYVTYDSKTGLSYTAGAATAPADSTHLSYTATVPSGICGLVIQSAQAPAAPPKSLQVSLVGPDGKQVAGTGTFDLICDKYTLNMTIKSSKDPVLPDGADQTTITANLTVRGPAQFVNGVKVKPSAPKIMLVSPLGLVMVHFNTSLGTIAPNPANVKTDLSGDAVVTLTSADAGIAKVQAVAQGIGDATLNVHFPPKITAVQENFVQPNSPTNYIISTIPQNGKDLTYDWTFIPAPGLSCGHLTGPASGLGESTNGFFHGPSSGFPDGCPEKWEFASKMEVTVTDKDGQSESKTFSARAFEGQGFVKLP